MIIAVVILSILLVISMFYNYKFGVTLLRLEDVLEECLDVIDQKYASMSEILARPLFYDSPEVRKVVEDVRDARNSLHKVAVVLYKNFDEKEEDKKNATNRR